MLLSVVIISWNSAKVLRECLAAVADLTARPDVELIRVDNGSTDGSQRIPDADVICLPKNMGVAYARNRGIERARGRYILLLDDDTVASPGAILEMVDYMESHPDTGICGCALLNAQGELQSSFKEYPGLGVKCRNLLGLGKRETCSLPDHPLEPCYVIGACQLIRREVVERIGLLDQKIFYGPEDADYCIRARKAGWKTVYYPHVSIVHHWRHISRRNPFSRISRLHIAALVHFYRRHRRLF